MSVRIAARSLTAEALAQRIGQVASRSVEVGQRLSPRSTGVHSQAFCIFDSPISSEGRPDEHIAWAIEFLRRASERLSAVLYDLEIDIRLGVSPADQSALALSSDELLFLGQLGVQVNIDLYPPEPEPEPEPV
jgi:hypothetical protein